MDEVYISGNGTNENTSRRSISDRMGWFHWNFASYTILKRVKATSGVL